MGIYNIFIPGIFILVNTKLKPIYNVIFKYISNIILDGNLNKKNLAITWDFEKVLMNFLKQNLIRCYFHYVHL